MIGRSAIFQHARSLLVALNTESTDHQFANILLSLAASEAPELCSPLSGQHHRVQTMGVLQQSFS